MKGGKKGAEEVKRREERRDKDEDKKPIEMSEVSKVISEAALGRLRDVKFVRNLRFNINGEI